MNLWEIPLNKIKGVSEKREKCLMKLGLFSLSDILMFYPKSYENRTVIKKIGELCVDDDVTVVCTLSLIKTRKINPKLSVTEILGYDDSGEIRIVFFNREYSVKNLKTGETYSFYGKVCFEYGRLTIKQPQISKATDTSFSDTYVPNYPLTKGITQNVMRVIVKNSLDFASGIVEETLPFELRQKYSLCERMYSLYNIHFPKNDDALKSASERIAFEEIFYLILGLRLVKKEQYNEKGALLSDFKVVEKFAAMLPYELTNAQKRVIREICSDLKGEKRVNRLIQGDVGSGKTVVASMAMLIAVNCGYQAALMAPTEILARQHFEEIKEWFLKFGYETVLLVSDLSAKERKEATEKIKTGKASIIIGTNALVFDKIEFFKLGFCITDEQHRFGVNNRMKLSQKGENVHSIVMSATPIPRTLALIIYGDMDVSVIDELPKGRREIITKIVDEDTKNQAYSLMIEELNKKHQAFVVCPLIEESETLEVENAVKLQEKLQKGILKNFKVGLLHGRMKGEEKDKVMADFSLGKYDVIVSTTVIEVGINIPNATVMMIENAERFGLACLHQLRGRVGRANLQSYCFLSVGNKKSIKRLSVMAKTNDGFKISEEDLKNRGPGEFFGTRQSGEINSNLQRISYSMLTVEKAKKAAVETSEDDISLKKYENRYIRNNIRKMFGETGLTI